MIVLLENISLDKLYLWRYNIGMSIISLEKTYASKSIDEKQPVLSYKSSEAVSQLLNVISDILAHEYVQTLKENPELFKK